MTQSTLAIVPAYNEAASVADVVRRIDTSGLGIDVLVVDDGSSDATAAIARKAGARVVELPFNLGIGGAVQTGYRYALENDYDFAIQIDGDGQHNPGEAALLLERINQEPRVGMVYGTRFAEDGGFRSSSLRRVGIRLFAMTLSLVTRQKVTDPTSGFRLCDRSAIALFARDYPIDYPEVEAIMLMHRHRLRSAEVPVQMSERSGGRSSITLVRSGYYMIKVLLAVMIGLFRAPEVQSVILAAQGLSSRLQAVAIIVTVALLFFVFELVRRRKLQERYSLLWLAAALVLLVLAIFSDLLARFSSAIGIGTPSNALFAVAIGFLVLLVLHFSTTISRLTDESKVLAQRLTLAEERLSRVDGQRIAEEQSPLPAGEPEKLPS